MKKYFALLVFISVAFSCTKQAMFTDDITTYATASTAKKSNCGETIFAPAVFTLVSVNPYTGDETGTVTIEWRSSNSGAKSIRFRSYAYDQYANISGKSGIIHFPQVTRPASELWSYQTTSYTKSDKGGVVCEDMITNTKSDNLIQNNLTAH